MFDLSFRDIYNKKLQLLWNFIYMYIVRPKQQSIEYDCHFNYFYIFIQLF